MNNKKLLNWLDIVEPLLINLNRHTITSSSLFINIYQSCDLFTPGYQD